MRDGTSPPHTVKFRCLEELQVDEELEAWSSEELGGGAWDAGKQGSEWKVFGVMKQAFV